MGVDLFFDMPRHDAPQMYAYHTIQVPTMYYINHRDSQISQHLQCDADWTGQLKVFLDKGWKLIDICMDITTLAKGTWVKVYYTMGCCCRSIASEIQWILFVVALKVRHSTFEIDTMWIFEKRKNSLQQNIAEYEGAIIEYLHKIKVKLP